MLGIENTDGYKWIQSYGGSLVINLNGNSIGVGKDAPTKFFDVNGTISAGKPGNGEELLVFNSERPWVFRQFGTGAETALELVNTGGLNKNFLIKTDGNVGIGLDNPLQRFEVFITDNSDYVYSVISNGGSGRAGLWLNNSTTQTGSTKVIFRNSNASLNGPEYWSIGSDRTDGNKFKIIPGADIEGNDQVVIDRLGRLGMGTNAPQGPIHILRAEAPPNGLPLAENGLLMGTNGTASYKWIQAYGGILSINPANNASQNVAIGKTTAAFQFELSKNSAAKPSSSAWTVISDKRLKQNIQSFKDG